MIDFGKDEKIHPDDIKHLHVFERMMRRKFRKGELDSNPINILI